MTETSLTRRRRSGDKDDRAREPALDHHHGRTDVSADFRRKAALWVAVSFIIPVVAGSVFAIVVFSLMGP